MSDQNGGPDQDPQTSRWQDPYAGSQPQHPADPASGAYGWGPTPYPPSAPYPTAPGYPPTPPYPTVSGYPTAPGYPPSTGVPVPPPERKRRVHPAVLIIGGIVVAAVIAGGLVALLAGRDVVDAPGTSGRSLAIPGDIAGYRALPGVDTDDVKANLADELTGRGDDRAAIEAHAAVGIFEQEATGVRTVFLGFRVRDVARLRNQLDSDGAEASLKFFMAGVGKAFGAGAASTGFPAGPLKGFLRCSAGTVNGGPATACGWGDESAIALTIFATRLSLNEAADETRTLRHAIEHR